MGTCQQLLLHLWGPLPSASFLQLPPRMGHGTNRLLYTINILRILRQQAGAATIAHFTLHQLFGCFLNFRRLWKSDRISETNVHTRPILRATNSITRNPFLIQRRFKIFVNNTLAPILNAKINWLLQKKKRNLNSADKTESTLYITRQL